MTAIRTNPAPPTVPLQYVATAGIGNVKPDDDQYRLFTFTGTAPAEEGVVSGVSLVISQGSNIGNLLDHRPLTKLTLVADRVELQMMLHLPGTEVRIFARELYASQGCGIDTTGTALPAAPSATGLTGDVDGHSGVAGQNGGDIHLYVGSFSNHAGLIFNLGGAAGQGAGNAVPATPGPVVAAWTTSDTMSSGFCSGSTLANVDQSASSQLSSKQDIVGIDIAQDYSTDIGARTIWGTRKGAWTPTGVTVPGPAKPSLGKAGTPGKGGDGGKLFCIKPIVVDPAWFLSIAGSGGPPGRIPGALGGYVTYQGTKSGAGSTYSVHIDTNGASSVTLTSTLQAIPDIPDAAGPTAASGQNGSIVQVSPSPASGWLHPLHMHIYRHFIGDMHAAGDFAGASRYLAAVMQALDAWRAASSTAGTSAATADDIAFGAGHKRFAALMLRLVQRVDAFGNPAGWTPTLSLATSLTAYKQQVDRALPALYLARWFDKYGTQVANKKASCTAGISTLQSDRDAARQQLSQLSKDAGSLDAQIAALAPQIAAVQKQMSAIEVKLHSQAKFDVVGAHLLKMASAVCSLVPVGQPELGMVGGGLDVVTNYLTSKNLTAANVGQDLMTQLSGVASYGLSKHASALDSELAKPDDDPTAPPQPQKTPDEIKREARAAKAANLHKLSDGLGSFAGTVTTELGGLMAPADDITAMLSQLEAADPAYQQLAASLNALNEAKSALLDRVNEIVQSINDLTGTIESGYQAEADLWRELGATTALDHSCLVAIRGMGQDALRTLRSFQYFMLKAYEYQLLAPLPGADLRVAALVTSIDNAVAKGTDPGSVTDYSPYQAALSGISNNVVTSLLTQVQQQLNAPKVSTYQYDLSQDELASINDSGENKVVLNLFERGLLDAGYENHRIESLVISAIKGTPVNNAGINRYCAVQVEYWGEGVLRSKGELFCVRSFGPAPMGTQGRNPVRTWSASYSEKTQSSTPDADSATFTDLLTQVIPETTATSQHIYIYCPPAWTDLVVRRLDPWLKLTQVTITVTVSHQAADQSEAVLTISEENGLIVPLELFRNSDGQLRRSKTTCFEIYTIGDQVSVSPGYGGVKMVQSLVDLDNPRAPDVAGTGPWTLDLRNVGRRLQLKMGVGYWAPPLTRPGVFAWALDYDKLAGYTRSHPYNWPAGGSVAYSLSFVDKNHVETVPGPWSDEFPIGGYVFPILRDIAFDPSGKSVTRRVYRRFTDAAGTSYPVEQITIKELQNNAPVLTAVDSNP